MSRFSINSIALGNLRQHKRTYLSMTVGIVLALFFSASLLLFWNSMQVSIQEIHNKRYGAQDVIYMNGTDEVFDELNGQGWLSVLGKASILEYISLHDPSENTGFSAAVFDDDALQLIDWEIDGRLPEKAGEIAMEQSALSKIQSDADIGDTITVSAYIPTGMGDDGEGTFLDKTVEKTYILVGILSEHYSYLNCSGNGVQAAYNDFPSAVLSKEESIEVGGKTVNNYYVKFSEKFWDEYDNAGDDTEADNLYAKLVYDCDNSDYIFRFATYDNDHLISGSDISNMELFVSCIMIVAKALILASCLGIINAFSANLRERQQQIGMLRAVAATKRQIRQIFGREAMLIALFSIFPAMLLSCLAVWGIIQLMGPGFRFILNGWILIGMAAVGLICIMVAAYIPLWRVSRIPPMQAIRDVSLSKKMKSRRIRTKKVFNVSSHLAKRNLSLNKGRQVCIIALITAGMFVVTSQMHEGMGDAFDKLRNGIVENDGSDFELKIDESNSDMYSGLVLNYNSIGMTERDRQDILDLQSVQTIHSKKRLQINIIPESMTDYLTVFGLNYSWNSMYLIADLPFAFDNEFCREERQQYLDVKQKYGYTKDFYTENLCAYDEDQLKAAASCLSEGEINLDKLASGEEVLVVAPTYSGAYSDILDSNDYKDYTSDDFTKADEQTAKQKCGKYLVENDMFHAGDTITLSQLYTVEGLKTDENGDTILPDSVQRIDREVTIGGILDANNGLGSKGAVITSTVGMSALGYDAKYNDFQIFLSESPSKEMEQYLENNLRIIAVRSNQTQMVNHVAQARDSRNIASAYLIAIFSVIILMFAICISMISNSFTAQIQAGKSYIGILRATGASERDIWKNYLYQLIYLFVRSGIIGVPLSIAVRCAQVWVNQYFFANFYLNWDDYMELYGVPSPVPALVLLVLMFVVCYCTTRRKVKQVLKGSIVQNIREL
ncbi:MAG: ABC transporter permease [Eubacteriales bacterium]|nr:ABC transporter permease [Eubacteriales bacterium]